LIKLIIDKLPQIIDKLPQKEDNKDACQREYRIRGNGPDMEWRRNVEA